MKQLQGSEKQIAWAEDLRKEFLEKAEEYKELLNKGSKEKSQDEKMRELSLQSQLGLRKIKTFGGQKKEDDELRKQLELTVGKDERKALSKEERRAESRKLREAKKEIEINEVNDKIEKALEETSAKVWIESRPK